VVWKKVKSIVTLFCCIAGIHVSVVRYLKHVLTDRFQNGMHYLLEVKLSCKGRTFRTNW